MEQRVESGERRAAFIVLVMALMLAAPGCSKPRVRLVSAGIPGGMISYYTCSLCGSVKTVTKSGGRRSETITYKSPGYAACPHIWKVGVSRFAEPPITDGRIMLVKRGRALDALILRNQKLQPAHTDFVWYYRNDGKGTFRKRDVGLFRTGSGSSRSKARLMEQLKFGPFSVVWCSTEDGKGMVAYAELPGGAMTTGDTLICPTTETDIEKIDATDPKWVYRASVGDPGRSGTAP